MTGVKSESDREPGPKSILEASPSAVCRIPTSVLSRVFSYLAGNGYKLSLVNSSWRDAAFATPHLWTCLTVRPDAGYRVLRDRARETVETLSSFLRRSDPLEISVVACFGRLRYLESAGDSEERRRTLCALGTLQVMRTLAKHLRRCYCLIIHVDHHALASAAMQALGTHCNDRTARLQRFMLRNAQTEFLSTDKGLDSFELLVPAANLQFVSLRSVNLQWLASFSLDIFASLVSLHVHTPDPRTDPTHVIKTPSYQEFRAAVNSMPALKSLDLDGFSPNVSTLPRSTEETRLWHPTLRRLRIARLEPSVVAQLLRLFDIEFFLELSIDLAEVSSRTLQLKPAETVTADGSAYAYDVEPVISALRGGEQDWQSVGTLRSLILVGIDVPWHDLGSALAEMLLLQALDIPCSEIVALLSPGKKGNAYVLPQLRRLALRSAAHNSGDELARMVRKALVQRAVLCHPLQTLAAPVWLTDGLRRLGNSEVYATEMRLALDPEDFSHIP